MRVSRSALVPYSAARMYRLVADIESYPKFLPWCTRARIDSRDEREVQATLGLSKGPVSKEFTTVNTLHPDERIDLRLLSGPFKSLAGAWSFVQLGDDGSRVQLDMDFEFSNRLLRLTVGPVFNEIVSTMVDAFSQRARELYG